jgi:hypothetical protein
MGREADEYASKVREIRKRAEKAAEEYLAVWRTSESVCIKKGGQVIRLTHDEAERVAKGVLAPRKVAR